MSIFDLLFGGQLKVNPEDLSSDANQIINELGIIETKIDKMYDDVKALGNMWKGVAKNTFVNNFESDYLNTKSFIASLQEYARRLENEGREYRNCENKVIDAVGNI